MNIFCLESIRYVNGISTENLKLTKWYLTKNSFESKYVFLDTMELMNLSSNNKLLIQYVELMRSLKIYVWNMLNYFFEGDLLEN